MWLGASASVSAPFRVSRAGVLTATTGTFSGTISGGTITGGTIDIGSGIYSFHVNSAGQIWSGNAAYASAPFRVNNDGTLFATSGTIGGSMVLSSSGTLTTGAGLGATTLGYSLSWSGGRSGIFSDGGGAGFASFTYGDISILTGAGGRGIIETALGTRGYLSSFDFFLNSQSTLHATAINVREGPPKRYYMLDNNDASTLTYFTLGGHTADVGSDRRLKSNIRSVSQESLDKFYSIKVHEWDWNENCDDSPNMWYWKDNPISIGVIADEIKESYPYVVDDEMPEERYASVAYSSLGPQMICAILDLNARVKELEARLGA
jgi:hypothetical protein